MSQGRFLLSFANLPGFGKVPLAGPAAIAQLVERRFRNGGPETLKTRVSLGKNNDFRWFTQNAKNAEKSGYFSTSQAS